MQTLPADKWTQIYEHFKVSEKPAIARIASYALARFVYEFHHYGNQCDVAHAWKIANRFQLGTFLYASMAVFPPKWI